VVQKLVHPIKNGVLAGTPGFASPEQLIGLPSKRSDNYSFGMVVIFLFTTWPNVWTGKNYKTNYTNSDVTKTIKKLILHDPDDRMALKDVRKILEKVKIVDLNLIQFQCLFQKVGKSMMKTNSSHNIIEEPLVAVVKRKSSSLNIVEIHDNVKNATFRKRIALQIFLEKYFNGNFNTQRFKILQEVINLVERGENVDLFKIQIEIGIDEKWTESPLFTSSSQDAIENGLKSYQFGILAIFTLCEFEIACFLVDFLPCETDLDLVHQNKKFFRFVTIIRGIISGTLNVPIAKRKLKLLQKHAGGFDIPNFPTFSKKKLNQNCDESVATERSQTIVYLFVSALKQLFPAIVTDHFNGRQQMAEKFKNTISPEIFHELTGTSDTIERSERQCILDLDRLCSATLFQPEGWKLLGIDAGFYRWVSTVRHKYGSKIICLDKQCCAHFVAQKPSIFRKNNSFSFFHQKISKSTMQIS